MKRKRRLTQGTRMEIRCHGTSLVKSFLAVKVTVATRHYFLHLIKKKAQYQTLGDKPNSKVYQNSETLSDLTCSKACFLREFQHECLRCPKLFFKKKHRFISKWEHVTGD